MHVYIYILVFFPLCGNIYKLAPGMAGNVTSDNLTRIYHRLSSATNKHDFLQQCIDQKLIPHGLRLGFSLALRPTNLVVEKIEQILNNASTQLLLVLCDCAKEDLKETKELWEKHRLENNEGVGTFRGDRMVGKLRVKHERTRRMMQKTSQRKIEKLRCEKREDTNVRESRFTDFKGTVHLTGKQFSLNQKQVEEKTRTAKQGIRPHRKIRRGKRSNNKKQKDSVWSPSEAEFKERDPIVLTDKVTLSKEQIEVCRLADCFVPTPTTPIDVYDQMIGTHEWAERLRWHRFFALKKLKDGSDNADEEDEEFQKFPWYKPTEKSAPRGDKALEDFIQQCSDDFLDINKRKRISDNLTPEQRKALSELRNLPMTHNSACRYADKSGVTVITSLTEDDEKIKKDLKDKAHFDNLESDCTEEVKETVTKFTNKWSKKGVFKEEMSGFIKNNETSHLAKCKPLIKTHKPQPYPHRLLLSGCGTPTEKLSKFIQLTISHLTDFLPYQILDTKEFLQKIEMINDQCAPLPPTACLATCDVVSLYPSVDNRMGVPAVEKLLKKHPSPLEIPTRCVIEGLSIALDNNTCYYEDGEGEVIYATPNNGTAMGPAHAPTYVDVFMGELDKKLVESCPVPLLSSLSNGKRVKQENLDWSRYRDDGFTVLPNHEDIDEFVSHLQELHRDKIRWTVNQGREAEYLDVKLVITEEGKIETDVFSKSSHSYLPPNSCHPPSVFKGMTIGMGRRLRMICSDDTKLENRIQEYTKHLVTSGWKWEVAEKGLREGASVPREQTLKKENQRKKRNQKQKKIAWVTRYDPRVPDKTRIIKKNLEILHKNPENKKLFPKKSLIAADRRRKNLGEIYKPTVPGRFQEHGPREKNGFFKCTKTRCDTCNHSREMSNFSSPWDGRKWTIRQNITCTTPNVIYIVTCDHHKEFLYCGSTTNVKLRWANHKSDAKLKRVTKCKVATHCNEKGHPVDPQFLFLNIIPIEHVRNPKRLLERELYWQANLGTLRLGSNERKDFHSIVKHRVLF